MSRITANHHVLAVPDAARSARFFVEVLGFALMPVVDPGWRFVRRDNVMIMLGSCPAALAPAELGEHAYFAYLVVDDVDSCYAEVRAAGARPLTAPADKPWRMREFALRTPDGHRLMLGQDLDTAVAVDSR